MAPQTRILSAMGSRMAPTTLTTCQRRASQPSKKSVTAATTKATSEKRISQVMVSEEMSPSRTARCTSSQEATCISWVVRRMLRLA